MTVSEVCVAKLAWSEVRDRLQGDALAILPIGAGAKQHGLHLPMSSDQIQAEWFAAELANRVDGLVWPTLSYGSYPAFVEYAGSISISGDLFEQLVRAVLTSLLGTGARRILVLNAGLSTVAPVDRAILTLPTAGTVVHAPMFRGPQFRRTVAEVEEQDHGSHADEIETSIMLAIAPEQVRMRRAVASPQRTTCAVPGPLTPFDAASPNYSPSGSFGDPQYASAAKGNILVAAILADLCALAATIGAG